MPTYKSGDVYVHKEVNEYIKLFVKESGSSDSGRWLWLVAGCGSHYPELSASGPEGDYYHYGNISELFVKLEAAIIAQIEKEGT